MRKVREVLRLRFEHGLSARQVAAGCGIARSTVAEYERRAQAAGLSWPLPAGMDDGALEKALFGPKPPVPTGQRGLPDVGYLKREMARKHVTLSLLWTEYREANPAGYGYTQFCEHYRRGVAKLDRVLRQEHRAGEKAFVDWAGDTIPVVDAETGEVWQANLFVAVLGASGYTFAEAARDQSEPRWITCHVHAYEFFDGAPAITVPDNTRTAVLRPCRYEPGLTPVYEDLATHYGTAIIPARVRRPRDKAAVEAAVLVAERWIVAALRHRTFFSLADLNDEIRRLLKRINERPFRRLPTSRRQLYEELDRPALRPLPAERYEWTAWKTATVHIDYHVELDRHFYSVPHELVGERVDARLSASMVEILFKNRRVASHPRSYVPGKYTTNPQHMPSSHRRYAEWTPARVVAWAAQTGPATAALAKGILQRRPHPEHGFRSCMGLVSLGRKYTPARLEAACSRALGLGAYSFTFVRSALQTGLDQTPPRRSVAQLSMLPPHENVRGSSYYEEAGR